MYAHSWVCVAPESTKGNIRSAYKILREEEGEMEEMTEFMWHESKT